MQADLVPTGQHAAKDGHSPVAQFFVNLQILADKNNEQAAILFGMLFTLIIWIFSALSLFMAAIFYITFLWHHIRDGSLSRYCRRKIDTRLHKIVMVRVNRALEKDSMKRAKQEARGVRVGTPQGDFKRQPTVPVLATEAPQKVEPLSKQTTQTNPSLPDSDRPTRANSIDDLHREPTVPDVFVGTQRPQPPSRSTTQSSAQSNFSYADNAPLMSSAAPLGYGPPGSRRTPARTNSDHQSQNYRPPDRGGIGTSQGTQRSFASSASQAGPLSRQNTDLSGETMSGFLPPKPPQARKPIPQNTSFDSGRPPGQPGINRRPIQEYEMQSQHPGAGMKRPPPRNGGYVAFNPKDQSRGAPALSGSLPARNFTQPPRPPAFNHFGSNPGPPQRSGTAPIQQAPLYNNDDLYDAYGGSWQEPQANPIPPRPATAGPGGWNGPRRPMPPRY